MRIALKFAYNGRNFYGYARQPNLKTVEGKIIDILTRKEFIKNTKESMFRSASRTDKGVSALGNVIAFDTGKSIENILEEINTSPEEILFYGVKEAEPDFYPRYAKQRIYRYYLKNDDFDIDKIISAASLFTGTHNFTNFARIEKGKNPVRTIDFIVIGETKDCVTFDFYAQTFLWHQIRRIMSAIDKIENNKLGRKDILYALNNPSINVDYGLSTAEPLILKDIIYDFVIKEKNVKKLEKFRELIIGSIENFNGKY